MALVNDIQALTPDQTKLKLAAFADLKPQLEKLRAELRTEMGKLDLQVLTIAPLIQLRYQKDQKVTEEVDNYNLIRDADEGSRSLNPKELKGRRIVAPTWSPTGGLALLKNLSFVNFQVVDDNSIKVSSGLWLSPTASVSVEFSLAIFHVPQ